MTQPLCPSSRSFVALDTAPSCQVMFLQPSVAPNAAACGFVAATSLLGVADGRWQRWSGAIELVGSAAAVGTCGLACPNLLQLSCWALVRPAESGLGAGRRCSALLVLWLQLSVTWLAAATAGFAPAKDSVLGLLLGAAPRMKLSALFALPLTGCAGEVAGARCWLLCLGWRGSFIAYNSGEGSCTGMAAWVCCCTDKCSSKMEVSYSSQLANCENLCVYL